MGIYLFPLIAFFGILFIFALKNGFIKETFAASVNSISRRRLNFKIIKTEEFSRPPGEITQIVLPETGTKVFNFINQYAPVEQANTFIISTTTRFNISSQPENKYKNIINLHKINDIRRLNKFFEEVNQKIPVGGVFVGTAETKNMRKKRILKKYPPVLNFFIYSIDFFIKRVLPKLPHFKKIYFRITKGKNRVLTKTEIMGRLFSCGFEPLDTAIFDNQFVFAFKKVKTPLYPQKPTYGPLIHLKRVGKNKKLFHVYKLRTMHPFSEYLQKYIHETNDLQEGGKFDGDFRICNLGRLLRKCWIDELPMFINFFRGDMQWVGVRPLSTHYFNLYPPELQEKRTKYKPGLFPPYYADMPKTLEEIIASEMKYLEAYEKNPFLTNWKYFWKITWNIFIRRKRSK